MFEVYKNIFVGTEQDCRYDSPQGWAFVHACKYPCHTKIVGYRGTLPKNHPHYLIYEKGFHLVLNMVDMEVELSPIYTNPIMASAISFIHKYISLNKILIHCNQGVSRAPSLALVYLANKGLIKNGNFNEAFQEFIRMYRLYQPAMGLGLYLNHNWSTLMKL
jgi:hypothetical protein